MNKLQFIYGAIITLALDALLLFTGVGGEIIKIGLVAALFILCAFIIIIKAMISRGTDEGKNTDWHNVKPFAIGSIITTIIVLIVSLVAIV